MTVEITSLEELKHFESMSESVVMYGATWCNPCKQFKPHFIKASDEFTIPFGIVYLDTLEGTTQEEQFVARGIQSVPTVRYYTDGAAIDLKEKRILPFIKELREASS